MTGALQAFLRGTWVPPSPRRSPARDLGLRSLAYATALDVMRYDTKIAAVTLWGRDAMPIVTLHLIGKGVLESKRVPSAPSDVVQAVPQPPQQAAPATRRALTTPDIFDCGCSRRKVAAGLCDVYDEHGRKR